MKSILAATYLIVILALASDSRATIERGFTDHFYNWLNDNGYEAFEFHRPDLEGSCYGGKSSEDEVLNNDPVIFIHGNTDIGVGYDYWQTGFTTSIEYFLNQGHTKAELYTTTWGTGDKNTQKDSVHSKELIEYLRGFVEAVLEYTGAEKVYIISFSMGVTLARRVVKGGYVQSDSVDLGEPLTSRVDTFIGIAGGNYGMASCYEDVAIYDNCNEKNGFYPGVAKDEGLSEYLDEMNKDPAREGSYTVGILSTCDDVIKNGDEVYGRYTSQWPTMDESKIYTTPEYTHLHLRDETVEFQYNLVVNHLMDPASGDSIF